MGSSETVGREVGCGRAGRERDGAGSEEEVGGAGRRWYGVGTRLENPLTRPRGYPLTGPDLDVPRTPAPNTRVTTDVRPDSTSRRVWVEG